jgi:glutathione S-transferase
LLTGTDRESGAILVYLVAKYDPENRISVPDREEKAQLLQWIMFQVSGQGSVHKPSRTRVITKTDEHHRSPYFGQSTWFQWFHSEHVPSAIARYNNEIRRVLGVLDSVLSKQEFLVGGKATIADLSFVPWNYAVPKILGEDFDFDREFPNTARQVTKISIFL